MAKMLRTDFERDLQELQDDLLAMGSMVEKAIARSLDALKHRDLETSAKIIHEDNLIDEQQMMIEDKCVHLIATQQPMASDLRALITTLHIAAELERMGDYAEGIAKISLMMGDEPPLKPLIDIPRMAEKVSGMLRKCLDAFVARDAEMAAQVNIEDDEVDALYAQVYRELLMLMIQDPKTIERATHLLWVAHNLERVADRATNICEQVVYLVTGKLVDVDVSRSTVRVRERQMDQRRSSVARVPNVYGGDEQFYRLLHDEATNLKDTAMTLSELMSNFDSLEDWAQKTSDLEHAGDEILHAIMRELHGTLITPLDRSDIATLAERLDDVVDHIEEAARDLYEFRVDAPTEEAAEMARILHEAGIGLEKAVVKLPNMKENRSGILKLCSEISGLEEQADKVGRGALMSLLNGDAPFNYVMKWREVYHHLEEAADSCQRAAIVIEGIVLEYASVPSATPWQS